METKVLKVTKIMDVDPNNLPDGEHKGLLGGNEVKIDIGPYYYSFTTKDVFMGIDIPCVVKIKEGVVTVVI